MHPLLLELGIPSRVGFVHDQGQDGMRRYPRQMSSSSLVVDKTDKGHEHQSGSLLTIADKPKLLTLYHARGPSAFAVR